MRPGARNLITDVQGLRVGNAQDQMLKSGVTVLVGEVPFVASVSVMGGAPGTRETDLLAPDKSVSAIDALVLAGGSAFGLAAAQGVMDGLHEQGRGFAVHNVRVPIVPAAILFDLVNGGDKNWGQNPYPKLGRAALTAASPEFELGSTGAGTGAMTAMFKGGLGSASVQMADGTTVGALVAVNPLGAVTTPSGGHFWAAPFELGDEFGDLGPDTAFGWQAPPESRKNAAMAELGNTTIAIVATDAPLSKAQCHRMATAAQDGIARAIVPAHSPFDGDLVFGLATGTGAEVDGATLAGLCHVGALCLSRAIARGVWMARPRPGDLLPCFRDADPPSA